MPHGQTTIGKNGSIGKKMSLNQIKENLESVHQKIQALSDNKHPCSLLCVTKYTSIENMQHLYDAGERHFAESKVQDAEKKQITLTQGDITWHMIGHLQRNKVKKAVQLFDCIQSVDSLRLLAKINEEAEKIQKKQDIYIQVNLTGEDQKYGFTLAEFKENLEQFYQFPSCRIKGIMAMGPHTDSPAQITKVFLETHNCYLALKKRHNTPLELSMGMSSDFELAIAAGSTMVRIGSLLTQ